MIFKKTNRPDNWHKVVWKLNEWNYQILLLRIFIALAINNMVSKSIRKHFKRKDLAINRHFS